MGKGWKGKVGRWFVGKGWKVFYRLRITISVGNADVSQGWGRRGVVVIF